MEINIVREFSMYLYNFCVRVCVCVIRNECKKWCSVIRMFTFELRNINDFICCFDDAILAHTQRFVCSMLNCCLLLVSKSKKVTA